MAQDINNRFCKNVLCIERNKQANLLTAKTIPHKMISKYPWSQEFQCDLCHAKYYACSICYKHHQSNKLFLKGQLYRHAACHNVNATNDNKRKHCHFISESIKKYRNDMNSIDNERNLNDGVTSECIKTEKRELLVTKTNASDVSVNSTSVESASSLVAKANCGTGLLQPLISNEDTMLHILLARFTSKITRYQRHDLCEIINLIKKKYSIRNNETSDYSGIQNISLDLPINDACIRQTYLTGSNSIMKNLPIPSVKVVENHSYVSVRECLSNWLLFNNTPSYISNNNVTHNTVERIGECKIAKQIYRRALKVNKNHPNEDIYCVLAIQWSDDFEPNNSIKSNRGSAWIKTLTFVSDDTNTNDISNTYPIAIGHKGMNHNVIESLYLKELQQLSEGVDNVFYSTTHQKNICVHLEVIIALGDQPERRSMNYLMHGNSLYGSRFGYSSNTYEIADKLPFCNKCYSEFKSLSRHKDSVCSKCLRWDVMTNISLSSTPAPKDYPQELLNKYKSLPPKKITWKMLTEAVNLTTTKIVTGKWTATAAKSYLSTCCINNNGYQELMNHCGNIKALRNSQFSVIGDENAQMIIKDANKYPYKYEVWKGGPYWMSNIEIKCFMDVIMHLLFLGVVKAYKEIVSDFIKKEKRWFRIEHKIDDTYEMIANYSLYWIPIITANNGWVSENYLGYSRLIKWYYLPNKLPIKRHEKCKDAQKKLCLFHKMTGSLYSMLAVILARKTNHLHIIKTDRNIKLFLSNLDRFQRHLEAQKDDEIEKSFKPIWLSKYNFQSLLNIPECMRNYGPSINYWEGSLRGEGYLRHVKPKLTNVRGKNWQKNTHEKLLEEVSIDKLVHNYTVFHDSGRIMKHKREERKPKMYHRYETLHEVRMLIKNGSPLSLVRLSDGTYKVVLCYGQKCKLKGVEVEFTHAMDIKNLEMSMHDITIKDECNDLDLKDVEEGDMVNYLLCLPKIKDVNDIHNRTRYQYYIIDSNWREMGNCGKLIESKCP